MTEPIRADRVETESVEWLWRDRIPRGMMTVVGGKRDQGKGLFCAHLAAEITRTRFRDQNGKHRWGRVLYSAAEDSHSLMTKPRLEAAGAVLNRIDLWRFRLGDPDSHNPGMFKELEERLLGRPYDLIVMDPMASHLAGGVSRHSDNIRKVTDPLSGLIEQTRAACIMVEHVLKRVPASGHPLDAIGGGSSGLVAACRMGFLFGVDPADADRRILAAVKHNICEKPKEIAFEMDVVDLKVGDTYDSFPKLLFEAEVTFDPMKMLNIKPGDAKMGRPADKRAAACEWLANYLYAAPGPVPSGKVFEDAQQYAIPQKTLRAAAKDMEIVKDPPGGGRNCTWDLPDELKARLDAANGVTRDDGKDKNMSVTDDDLEALLGGD